MTTATETTAAIDWLAASESASVERLKDWLRIKSISTDPAFKPDVAKAAQWAADHLKASGLEVSIKPTGDPAGDGHPIVLATTPNADPSLPHVLFYGHYDVQPVDPVDLWNSDPFDPQHLPADPDGPGERLVARGASDDKGQVHMFLEAARAWHETTGLPLGGARYTVLLEGEEESGSVNLERWVEQNADLLKQCDVCVISDTGMLGRGRPAITYGVRGLTYTEVTLQGPSHDLHSGMWGGKMPNPLNELARILGKLWDDSRRVVIPGFYEGVNELTAQERAEWEALNIDEAEAFKGIGLPIESSIGESGFSFIEREWARPTAEINGMWGGYTDTGAKTVIPTHATAKVSFRLVDNQDPDKVRDRFFAWLESHTPPGCQWKLTDHGGGAPVTCARDSDLLKAATRAIENACGAPPAMIKTGGSIPVAGLLKTTLGIETIFMGFGLEDDRVHSPNEKFELECFRQGARSHAALIGELLATNP